MLARQLSDLIMIPEDMLTGRYAHRMSPEAHADMMRFYHRVHANITWSVMETWVESLGGELMECHCVMHAMDVVGVAPWKHFLVDEMRPVGVLVRHFTTHEARLAEFQSRLDCAVDLLQKRKWRS